jgi:hypothetical protein
MQIFDLRKLNNAKVKEQVRVSNRSHFGKLG